MRILFLFSVILSIQLITGTCTQDNVKTYSTADINLSSQTVFTAEFSILCDKEEEMAGHFYAEVNGRVVDLAKGVDKYQVTWTDKHTAASPGRYALNVYNEEGFAMFRKVQRLGSEEVTSTPMFVLDIDHPGARSPKPNIPIESFFILSMIGVMWFAFIRKSLLLE